MLTFLTWLILGLQLQASFLSNTKCTINIQQKLYDINGYYLKMVPE